MEKPQIRFNQPYIAGKELENIQDVFREGHFAGNGKYTNLCQKWLEEKLGCNKVLLTHSCTGALEIASLLLDLGPGDEVIMPSFTFVTTASSIMRTGAKPVFCEINPDTMNIDLDDVESKISENTKAIVPVHYAGFCCDMDSLVELANQNNIPTVEDAAQGLGSSWKNRPLGTISDIGCISFHETKNIHSGLGGCLLINNVKLETRAEIIWERGTDRGAFFKGLVDKYSWRELGSSFYPSEIQAAFLYAQLKSMDENLELRKSIWEYYVKRLQSLESIKGFRVLRPIEGVSHNSHMLAIIFESSEESDRIRKELNENGINAVIHYVPLHTSKMGQDLGYSVNDLPITADYSSRLLRLPLHHGVSEKDVDFIVEALANFT